MINVIKYAKVLSSINNEKFNGSFIGKIKFERFKMKESESISYDVKEIKSNKLLSVIEIKCIDNNVLLEKMTVTIVLSSKKKGNDFNKQMYKDNSIIDKNYFMSFTKKDILYFSNMVKDKNPIHLQEHSVVQGMLLLKELSIKYNISKNFIIRFLNPVYEMDKVYLYEYSEDNKKMIEGISRNYKFFRLSLEE